MEELKKLYYLHFQARENYQKTIKENKPKFKFNFKIGIMIVIPVVIISFLLVQFIWKPFGENPLSAISPSKTGGTVNLNETKMKEEFARTYNFTIEKIENGYVTIKNLGVAPIYLLKIYLDGNNVTYNLTSGSLPLNKNQELILNVNNLCDKNSHELMIDASIAKINKTVSC